MKTELANYLNAETEKLKAGQRKNAAGHTPGPWYVKIIDDGSFLIAPGDDGAMVAEVIQTKTWPRKAAEVEANARLIAAAPELLAAVEKMPLGRHADDCAWVQSIAGKQARRHCNCGWGEFQETITAAITKARGESLDLIGAAANYAGNHPGALKARAAIAERVQRAD